MKKDGPVVGLLPKIWEAWLQIPPLPQPSCVSLGKSLSLSVPPLPPRDVVKVNALQGGKCPGKVPEGDGTQ